MHPKYFPNSYNAYKKDRVQGGGVFTVLKRIQLQKNSHFSMSKLRACVDQIIFAPIRICSFYRPPNSDLYPIEQLSVLLAKFDTVAMVALRQHLLMEVF